MEQKLQYVIGDGGIKRVKRYLTDAQIRILSERMGWDIYNKQETDTMVLYFFRKRLVKNE